MSDVFNAFRRGVLLGLITYEINETRTRLVFNAFRRGVLLGRHGRYYLPAGIGVFNAFRRGVLLGRR